MFSLSRLEYLISIIGKQLTTNPCPTASTICTNIIRSTSRKSILDLLINNEKIYKLLYSTGNSPFTFIINDLSMLPADESRPLVEF